MTGIILFFEQMGAAPESMRQQILRRSVLEHLTEVHVALARDHGLNVSSGAR